MRPSCPARGDLFWRRTRSPETHALDTYRYLANTAFMLVAVEDERDDFPHARAMNNQFLASYGEDNEHPGLAAAARIASARPLDAASIERQEEEFFHLTVERSLAGAAALLQHIRPHADQ